MTDSAANSKLWCPLPWSHVAVKSNGYLRICSHSQSGGNKNTLLQTDNKLLRIEDIPNDILNCDTLKQVRSDFLNGDWPEQCRRCKIEKESGGISRNEWEATLYDFTLDDAKKITQPDGTLTNTNILSLDLRLGNKCNIQCIMCYPGESDKWFSIQETITGSKIFKIDDTTYNVDDVITDFDWANKQESYNLLTNTFPNITKIKFGGGEPLIIRSHVQLLENFIRSNKAKNVELEYSINCTVLPNYITDLWKEFKVVKICVSIDGLGIVNDTIRFPSKFDIIESNLDKLDNSDDNIIVFTSSTLSILNIEHFSNLMLWLNDKKYRKINKFSSYVSHPVMNPKYLNIGLMNSNQQERMFTHLRKNLTNKEMLSKIDYWENYCKSIPIDNIDENRKFLKDFMNKMSKIQNRNYSEIFPMCNQMVKEWNV